MSLSIPDDQTRIRRGSQRHSGFTLKRRHERQQEAGALVLEVSHWLHKLCGIVDHGATVLASDDILTGVTLCRLIRKIDRKLKISVNRKAKPGSFQARDNLTNFIDAAISLGVHEIKKVEVEDIIHGRNKRGVLSFILSLAKEAYLKFGTPPPQIVKLEMEIDQMRQQSIDFGALASWAPSLSHEEYVPQEDDRLDEWIAEYCNLNQVPVTATPMRLGKRGDYVFPCDKDHFVYHVRLIRGIALARIHEEWQEFASVINAKMQHAFAEDENGDPSLIMSMEFQYPDRAKYADESSDSEDFDAAEMKTHSHQKTFSDASLLGNELNNTDTAPPVDVLPVIESPTRADVVDGPRDRTSAEERTDAASQSGMEDLQLDFSFQCTFSAGIEALSVRIQDWWSNTMTYNGDPGRAGSRFTVDFANGHAKELIVQSVGVDEHEQRGEICWKVAECSVGGDFTAAKAEEWQDSLVKFLLEVQQTDAGRTLVVHLTHVHMTEEKQSYIEAKSEWLKYIGRSLRQLLESGQGVPYPKVSALSDDEQPDAVEAKILDAESTEEAAGRKLLEEARRTDLQHIEKEKVMYICGTDCHQRPLLVIIGYRIPPVHNQRMYHLLLYLALLLEKISVHPDGYSVIYCHTRTKLSTKHFSWLNNARKTLPHSFRKQLKELHVMHPSFFVKTMFAFVRPWVSSKFWQKLFYYKSTKTEQIANFIAPQSIKQVLPAFVLLHGMQKERKQGTLFGGTLAVAQHRNPDHDSLIPRVVYECVTYLRSIALETEGLFRVSANQTLMKDLEQRFETDDDVCLFAMPNTPDTHHVVASLLKRYLRSLSEPLVTPASHDLFLSAKDAIDTYFRFVPGSHSGADARSEGAGSDEETKQMPDRKRSQSVKDSRKVRRDIMAAHADPTSMPLRSGPEPISSGQPPNKLFLDICIRLQEAIEELPPLNKTVLHYLIDYFHEHSTYEEYNLMSAGSLAIVLSPALLQRANETPEAMLSESRARCTVLHFLIAQYNLVFDSKKARRFSDSTPLEEKKK